MDGMADRATGIMRPRIVFQRIHLRHRRVEARQGRNQGQQVLGILLRIFGRALAAECGNKHDEILRGTRLISAFFPR